MNLHDSPASEFFNCPEIHWYKGINIKLYTSLSLSLAASWVNLGVTAFPAEPHAPHQCQKQPPSLASHSAYKAAGWGRWELARPSRESNAAAPPQGGTSNGFTLLMVNTPWWCFLLFIARLPKYNTSWEVSTPGGRIRRLAQVKTNRFLTNPVKIGNSTWPWQIPHLSMTLSR